MEMKVLAGTLAVATLLLGSVVPAAAKPKAKVVFKDVEGDAGNQDDSIPGFAEAGFDLVKGKISKRGKKKIKFVVTHSAMPETGPPGEAFRLIWGIFVDETRYEMTIKSFDVGEPDVISTVLGQEPNGEERIGQVYQGVARLEECGIIDLGIPLVFSQCTAIGYYDAVFDPATATATWVIDRKTMKAKKGSVISGGTGGRTETGCMICWLPHYQERSLTPLSIIDSATQTEKYKIP